MLNGSQREIKLKPNGHLSYVSNVLLNIETNNGRSEWKYKWFMELHQFAIGQQPTSYEGQILVHLPWNQSFGVKGWEGS